VHGLAALDRSVRVGREPGAESWGSLVDECRAKSDGMTAVVEPVLK
jgi:hypothetical protein